MQTIEAFAGVIAKKLKKDLATPEKTEPKALFNENLLPVIQTLLVIGLAKPNIFIIISMALKETNISSQLIEELKSLALQNLVNSTTDTNEL